MKNFVFAIITLYLVATGAQASENSLETALPELKNYQVNNAKMVSSGLPTQVHLETLKTMGITKVIDLIPDDRTAHSELINSLQLTYHNIAVDWENPTIENFREYVATMQQFSKSDGVTLTHCRLNLRGSAFTYLYRVTQLNESEQIAKQDMLAIWQPNEIWQAFIEDVLAEY